MPNKNNAPTLAARLADPLSQWTGALASLARNLRVALPGVIVSFDATKQTASVRLALTEKVSIAGVLQDVALKTLTDVPVVIPRAGGFTLTLPVVAGDECLVVFADREIDSWFQSGASSNAQNQIGTRRHSIADGFAILGPWSQPRVLSSYSTTSAQLRSDDGTVTVDVAAHQVTVTAPTVNVAGSTAVNITGGHCTIDGKNFLAHEHLVSGSPSGPVI